MRMGVRWCWVCLGLATVLGCELPVPAPETDRSDAALRNMAADPSAEGVPSDADREPNDRPEQAVEVALEGRGPVLLAGVLTGGAADVDHWLLKGEAGAMASLKVTPSGGGDIILGVVRPEAGAMWTLDNAAYGGTELIPNLRLTPQGVVVAIMGRGEADIPYSMEITLGAEDGESEPNDRPEWAQRITPGTLWTAYLNKPGDVDYFLLQVNKSPADIRIVPPKEAMLVTLMEGNKVIWQVQSSGPSPVAFSGLRPTAQPYLLRVQALDDIDAVKIYQVALDIAGGSGPIELEPNDAPESPQVIVFSEVPLQASLSRADDLDHFRVIIPALAAEATETRQVLTLRVRPRGTLDLALELRSALTGLMMARPGGDPGGERAFCGVDVIAGDSIDFRVALQPGAKWSDVDNAYEIHLALRHPVQEEREPNDVPEQATPIALGEPLSGTLHPVGDRDVYRFVVPPLAEPSDLRARVTMRVAEGYPVRVRLDLRDEQMADVAVSDRRGRGEGEVLEVDLPSGAYYATVHSQQAAPCTHSYRFSVEVDEAYARALQAPLVKPIDLTPLLGEDAVPLRPVGGDEGAPPKPAPSDGAAPPDLLPVEDGPPKPGALDLGDDDGF